MGRAQRNKRRQRQGPYRHRPPPQQPPHLPQPGWPEGNWIWVPAPVLHPPAPQQMGPVGPRCRPGAPLPGHLQVRQVRMLGPPAMQPVIRLAGSRGPLGAPVPGRPRHSVPMSKSCDAGGGAADPPTLPAARASCRPQGSTCVRTLAGAAWTAVLPTRSAADGSRASP
ncbi:hypothetical protein KUF71_025397 [Frankliniella fusca]|uniref:Uncharacterized protein n=1 Tax=Frankliniella fusca TaxID=407009 RepID=A0AAE1H7B7_9NEOP|nr:hypothetical protein KUF71_025397 [Frankliniella fusca]